MRKHETIKLTGTIKDIGMYNENNFKGSGKHGKEADVLLYLETDKEWISIKLNGTSAAKLALYFSGEGTDINMLWPTCHIH